jgi:hypothetical protein
MQREGSAVTASFPPVVNPFRRRSGGRLELEIEATFDGNPSQ